jgi:hypothetical protein
MFIIVKRHMLSEVFLPRIRNRNFLPMICRSNTLIATFIELPITIPSRSDLWNELFRKLQFNLPIYSTSTENLTMDPNPDTNPSPPSPGLLRYVLGFLLVGAAWGLTTPFMRRAALTSSASTPESRSWLTHPSTPYLKAKIWGILYSVYDTLKNPAYAVPFLINVTGSVWFFLLIGQAELSLTVPITNSLAFLFTVLGEWWAEKKVITKGKFCTLLPLTLEYILIDS